MTVAPLICTRCRGALEVVPGAGRQSLHCAHCASPLEIDVFPALWQPARVSGAGEVLLNETESACFFHPQKRAAVPCDACGRFLCSLCDCVVGSQHLCPTCLEAGRRGGQLRSLQARQTLHDRMALSLAVIAALPCLWFIAFVPAGAAIFVALRYWNAGAGPLPRTRWRSVLALVLGFGVLGGWIFFIGRLIYEGATS